MDDDIGGIPMTKRKTPMKTIRLMSENRRQGSMWGWIWKNLFPTIWLGAKHIHNRYVWEKKGPQFGADHDAVIPPCFFFLFSYDSRYCFLVFLLSRLIDYPVLHSLILFLSLYNDFLLSILPSTDWKEWTILFLPHSVCVWKWMLTEYRENDDQHSWIFGMFSPCSDKSTVKCSSRIGICQGRDMFNPTLRELHMAS